MIKEQELQKQIKPYIEEIIDKIDDSGITDIALYGTSTRTIMFQKKDGVWNQSEEKYFNREQFLNITQKINHKLDSEYEDWTEYHVFYHLATRTYKIEFKFLELSRFGIFFSAGEEYFKKYYLHIDKEYEDNKELIAVKQLMEKHEGETIEKIDKYQLTHKPNPHQIKRQQVLDFPMEERSNFHIRGIYSIFSLAIGVNLTVQRLFNQALGKYDHYQVDMDKGKLWLGDQEYNCEFIGSYSKNEDTWLWGYNNINHFNEDHLNIVNDIKKWGEKINNWYLSTDKLIHMYFVHMDYLDYRSIYYAALVSGIQRRPMPYYTMDQGESIACVLITNADEELFEPIDAESLVEMLYYIRYYTGTVSNLNYGFAVEGLLRWNGTPYEWKDEKTLIAHLDKDVEVGFAKRDFEDGDYDLYYNYSYIIED